MAMDGSLPFTGSQMNVARNILEELKAERNSLDASFTHCIRLIEEEINKLTSSNDPKQPQKEKIFVDLEEQKKYNLIGRLLGPKGLTLKRIQAETGTKMSILGRGSIKDPIKEEELRISGKPMYDHLREDLHILIEASPPAATSKVAAGVAEVRKMLIPPEPGQPDFSMKYSVPGAMTPGQSQPSGWQHEVNRERRHDDISKGSNRWKTSATDDSGSRHSWKEATDTWRTVPVKFKDYNHGANEREPYNSSSYSSQHTSSGGRYGISDVRYGNDYSSRYGGNNSTNSADLYPPTRDDGYFNDFADVPRRDRYGMRSRHTMDNGGHRHDYRHHPYSTSSSHKQDISY